jgi:hypothetical protein
MARAIDISSKGIGIGCDAPILEVNPLKLKFKRPYRSVDREVDSHVRRISLGDDGRIPRLWLELISPEPGLIPPFGNASHCA